MSTKTDRLGLQLWEKEDPVTMAGFNENHQALENMLGHAAAEKLLDITISAAAAAVSIPMSGIDWSRYDRVIIDHVIGTDDTTLGTNIRVNGSTDAGQGSVYYRYNSGDPFYSDERITSTFTGAHRRRIRFNVYRSAASPIMLFHEFEHSFGFGSWPQKTYGDMSTLVFSAASSGKLIQPGGTITVWGVRGW